MRGSRGNKDFSIATLATGGGFLLNSDTVMKDTGKTKGLRTSFALAFPGKAYSQVSPGLCVMALHLESSSTHGPQCM